MPQSESVFDAISALEESSNRVVRYVSDKLNVTAAPLQKTLEDWKEFQSESKGKEIKAYGPLLVEPGFRPKQGKAVNEVKCLHESTKEILNWGERFAYEHQIESWKASIEDKKTIIVSAGTGSGKTECFNVPILDALIREGAEKGVLRAGVRALIVYPLNALVNDQMSRWREWLKRQERILPEARKIRVATFNSRLKETDSQGREQIKKKKEELKGFEEKTQNDFLPAEPYELTSRDQLRKSPPHILITNYSMLEYMLLRPQDDPIFDQSFEQLKFIVLDEAHVYSAGLAGDIALLLRRSMKRFGVDPYQIQGFATSATFGTANQEPLRKFVADLFNQTLKQVSIIYGKTTPSVLEYQKTAPVQSALVWGKAQALSDLISKHGKNVDFWQEGGELYSAIQEFGISYTPPSSSQKSWELALKEALSQCWEFNQLLEVLTEKEEPLRLSKLQEKFQARLEKEFQCTWSSELLEQGVMTLLRLGALAKNEDGSTLQPVRLHAVSRGIADGFHVCLNPECTEAQKHPERIFSKANNSEYDSGILRVGEAGKCVCGSLTFPLWNCKECGSIYGVAKEEAEGKCTYLETPQEKRFENSLFLLHTPIENQNREYTEDSEFQPVWASIDFEDSDIILKNIFKSASKNESTIPYWSCNSPIWQKDKKNKLHLKCPCCAEKKEYYGFTTVSNYSSRLPMISGIMQEIPNRPEQKENLAGKQKELPGHGKNLLTFSDSRQEAARLAPLFADTHNRYLFAAACLEVLKQYQGDSEEYQNDLKQDLKEILDKMKDAEGKRLERLKGRLQGIENDLEEAKGGIFLKNIPQKLTEIPWIAQLRMAESIGDTIKNEALKKRLTFRLMEEYMGASPVNLENLGLIEFIYPKLSTFDCPELSKLGFSPEDSRLLVRAYLDLFRIRCSVRATLADVFVSWGNLTEFPQHFRLNGAESWNTPQENKRVDTGISLKAEVKAWPKKMKGSSVFKIAQKFKKSLNSDLDDLKLIFAAWQDIEKLAKQNGHVKQIVFGENENHAYQIVSDDCILKLSSQIFQCKRCHALSSVNFFNQCKKHKCSGELEDLGSVDFESLQKITQESSGRAFRIWELIEDPVGYRTMEHTAQRNVENLEIEEIFFRRGERNLMSSSTTLELGVDIGDLSAVFMNNTPPQSKNYKQRAGRAGRSGQGMALSLTLAGNAPQDHWFYRDPDRFLNQKQHLPWVLLNSTPLVQRHVNAVIFSFFYRQLNLRNEKMPQQSYGKLINFIAPLERQGDQFSQNVLEGLKLMFPNQNFGNQTKLYEVFILFLEQAPTEELLQELRPMLQGTVLEIGQGNGENLFEDLRRRFEKKDSMILKVEDELKQLEKEKSHANNRLLKLIERQISMLEKQALVSFLAKQGVLPRYGFPLDVIKLDHVRTGDEESGEEIGSMERNLGLAIWEYAPGNEITFNGRAFTVKGVSASPYASSNTLWETTYYQRCPHCYRVESSKNPLSQRKTCKYCKKKLEISPYKASYIQPHGFKVDFQDEGHRVTQHTQFRPSNTYALPGDLPVSEAWDRIGELEMAYEDHFELLNLNQGDPVYSNDGNIPQMGFGFHVCTVCGVAERAKSFDSIATISRGKHLHDFKTKKKCTQSHYSKNISFGVRFRSEALFLKFKDTSRFSGEEAQKTAAQVFRLAATKLMSLDIRNLEAHITQDDGAILLILFETQEGGSGILSLLRNRLDEWLKLTVELANEDCSNPSCEIYRSCPECLLSFDKQKEKDLITRESAREIFNETFENLYCKNSVYEKLFGSDYQVVYGGFSELIRELRRAEKIILVISNTEIWEKFEVQLRSLLRYRIEQGLVGEATQVVATQAFYEQFQTQFVWASFGGVQCSLSDQNEFFPLIAFYDDSTPCVMTHDFSLPVISKKVNAISSLKRWEATPSDVLKINEAQKWTTSKILKRFIGARKVQRALYSDRFVWAGTKNRKQFHEFCQSIPWKDNTLNMLLITQQELHDHKGGWHITEELQSNGTVLRYRKKREMDHPRLMYFELDNGEYCYLASDQGLAHITIDEGEEPYWKSTHIARFKECPYQKANEISNWMEKKPMKPL